MMTTIKLICLPQKIWSLKGPPEGISSIVWLGRISILGVNIMWTYWYQEISMMISWYSSKEFNKTLIWGCKFFIHQLMMIARLKLVTKRKISIRMPQDSIGWWKYESFFWWSRKKPSGYPKMPYDGENMNNSSDDKVNNDDISPNSPTNDVNINANSNDKKND